MADFDGKRFEYLMWVASDAHRLGLFSDAQRINTEAYSMAPDGSIEQGRAARDISANADKQGDFECAGVWAARAFQIHNSGVARSFDFGVAKRREIHRERGASATYLAMNGLRSVLESRNFDDESRNQEITAMAQLGRSDSRVARKNAPNLIDRLIDQYDINLARRQSLIESVVGKKTRGLMLGVKAVAIAVFSESPRLDTSNKELSLIKRANAKRRALEGGAGALAVALLFTKRDTRRQNLAINIADKVL